MLTKTNAQLILHNEKSEKSNNSRQKGVNSITILNQKLKYYFLKILKSFQQISTIIHRIDKHKKNIFILVVD